MALTVSNTRVVVAGAASEYESVITVTALTSDLLENVAHAGPTGCTPSSVRFTVSTPPTDHSVVSSSWESTNTTNDTIAVRFTVPAGGSLDGASVKIVVNFIDQGTGGLSTITTT